MGELDEGTVSEGTEQGLKPEENKSPAAGTASQGQAADDPKPDGKSWNMTQAAFNERIAQAKRSAEAASDAKHQAWLKERFGSADLTEAEKKLASLTKLEKDEADRQRAAMSEQDRLKADLEKQRQETATYKARAEEAERSWQHEKQSTAIERIALGHVAPDHVDYATFKFASHVRSLPKDEQAALTEKDVTKWYADFAKKHPAFSATPEQKKEAKTEARKQPVGSGEQNRQPQPKPNAGAVGKVLAPGHPNSMTSQEARAAMRKQGISY